MSSAATLTSTTRMALEVLVGREQRRYGRMVAYENVAKKVGTSSSWIRKFLAGSADVKEPRLTLFQNIRASYDNLCSRIEEENRADELRLMLIRENLNAATEGFAGQAGPQDQADTREVNR